MKKATRHYEWLLLTRYVRIITQPKRPLTKINRMYSDMLSLIGEQVGIRSPAFFSSIKACGQKHAILAMSNSSVK